MAQEFRLYDEKYAFNRGKTLSNISCTHGTVAPEDYVNKKSWLDFMPGWEYVIHGREEIRDAVYRHPSHEDWQFFRVGLHGLSTQIKLYCLAWYWAQGNRQWVRKIRIDNYLGALIRGGQLNDRLEIMK